MSSFGDGNPKTKMTEELQYIIRDYNMTAKEFLEAIGEVISYLSNEFSDEDGTAL